MNSNCKILWVDAVTANPEETSSFYNKVLGLYPCEVLEGDNQISYSMQSGGDDIMGVLTDQKFKDWIKGWVLYFNVQDYDHAIDQATANGGEIFKEFTPSNLKHPRSCLLKDPAGNPIMISEDNQT